MDSKQRFFWGVLAFGPWVWLLFFGVFEFYLEALPGTFEAKSFLAEWWYLISLIVLMVIWIMFIYHARTNKAVPNEKRSLWTWVIVFGNFYVYPFYWYHYVHKAA